MDQVLGEIARRGLTLDQIWITHGHLDHAGGAAETAGKDPGFEHYRGLIEDDVFWIEGIPAKQGQMYGLPEARTFTPDRWLGRWRHRVSLGDTTWEVIHCARAYAGACRLLSSEKAGFAQVGDVLFQGSIGRTDFPRSDHAGPVARDHPKALAPG